MEEQFLKKLATVKTELQAFDLMEAIRSSTAYYQLENNIKRTERRGVRADTLREQLTELEAQTVNVYRESALLGRANEIILVFDQHLTNSVPEHLVTAVSNLFSEMEEELKEEVFELSELRGLVLEDCSGEGNIFGFGFSEDEEADDEDEFLDDIIVDEVGEFDLRHNYESISPIREIEDKLPISIVGDQLMVYADTITRILLYRAFAKWYDNLLEQQNTAVQEIANRITHFFHGHHDDSPELFFQRKD